MASIREQILQAMLTALNTSRPVGIPAATRDKADTWREDDLPAIDMSPATETPVPIGTRHSTSVERTLTVRVECVASTTLDGDPASESTDAMLNWVVQALVDNTLGGLASNVDEAGIEWRRETAKKIFQGARLTLAVRYKTLKGDPESRS